MNRIYPHGPDGWLYAKFDDIWMGLPPDKSRWLDLRQLNKAWEGVFTPANPAHRRWL